MGIKNQRRAQPRTAPRFFKHREKMDKVVALRLSGAKFPAIGRALNMNPRAAWTLFDKAMKEQRESISENAAEARAIELARLDDMQLGLWGNRTDPFVTNAILRIMERRAKLLGLDAAEPIVVFEKEAPLGIDPDTLTTEELVVIDRILQRQARKSLPALEHDDGDDVELPALPASLARSLGDDEE